MRVQGAGRNAAKIPAFDKVYAAGERGRRVSHCIEIAPTVSELLE